jgi:arabinofuranosyltransferase
MAPAADAPPEPSRPRAQRVALAAVVAVLAAGVVAGALQLAFLCDDAFITFRHVAQARAGHGLVWNAPPFAPVEGYTGFAWALLLWAAWSVTGVEPPDAANPLSIALGVATFVVAAIAVARVRLRDGRPLPLAVAALVLAVLAGNRTFLQWLTGGLETALFDGCYLAWAVLAFRSPERRGTGWLAAWSGAAALAALTRPDGLLPVAATAAVAVLDAARRSRTVRATLLGLLPLAAVGAHVVWRRACYGEWLPNTYFAKVTAPWPEAGWRYLYCFVFEHGTWWWGLVAAAWLAVAARAGALAPRALLGPRLPAVAVVGAAVAHVGYYTLRVGGDHFEYRVFANLVPLFVLSAAAMAASLSARAVVPAVAVLALGLAGAVGWVHLAVVRQQPPPVYASLASGLSAWARPLVREYDRHQAWLQLQFVCMRCSRHASSLAEIAAHYDESSAPHHGVGTASSGRWPRWRVDADPHDVPVLRSPVVGLVAWKLPEVNVLDELGLCDRVIARSPGEPDTMAWLPADVLRAVLARADADGDGGIAAAELAEAFVAVRGEAHGGAVAAAFRGQAQAFADALAVVFATGPGDTLTAADRDRLLAFRAGVRFMAHERRAPPGYIASLDPNVTIERGRLAVRARAVPLTAERVRAIETQWWDRVRR